MSLNFQSSTNNKSCKQIHSVSGHWSHHNDSLSLHSPICHLFSLFFLFPLLLLRYQNSKHSFFFILTSCGKTRNFSTLIRFSIFFFFSVVFSCFSSIHTCTVSNTKNISILCVVLRDETRGWEGRRKVERCDVVAVSERRKSHKLEWFFFSQWKLFSYGFLFIHTFPTHTI